MKLFETYYLFKKINKFQLILEMLKLFRANLKKINSKDFISKTNFSLYSAVTIYFSTFI